MFITFISYNHWLPETAVREFQIESSSGRRMTFDPTYEILYQSPILSKRLKPYSDGTSFTGGR